MIILLALIVLLASATASVTRAPGSEPAFSAEDSTPARVLLLSDFATPEPLDFTAIMARDLKLQEEAAQRFWSAFFLDFSQLYECMDPNIYHRFGDVWDVFTQTEQGFARAALEAAKTVAVAYPDSDALKTDIAIDLPWRQLAGLYCVYGTRLHTFLEESLTVEIQFKGERLTSLRVTLPDFFSLAACGTANDAYHARMAYFYLNTVFADGGEYSPTLYKKPELPEDLMAELVPPLPYIRSRFVRNTWGEGRSRRTRLHMGTDIRIGQVAIFSCSDGTVLFSSYNTVSGNYVCVVDARGYEYQYMHMRELSPFVKPGDEVRAGQQIGWVGTTGNSIANHLHFSMVTPEHQYLNTYYVIRLLAQRDLWSKR
ncbi:MAG: M23 family metallopeptidase [Clostridiales bacterium]|nr:M23 family metallopeptidase [Clostridiales bacterium]